MTPRGRTGRTLAFLWALPWTAVGAAMTPLVKATGGRAAVRSGVLELSGGILPRLLSRLPPGGVAAITIGYTVLARDDELLESTRAHERVHVEQFGRWGPLFPVVYGLASLAALISGGHYYRDNVFEREATIGRRDQIPS